VLTEWLVRDSFGSRNRSFTSFIGLVLHVGKAAPEVNGHQKDRVQDGIIECGSRCRPPMHEVIVNQRIACRE
jgi:hypothetical protein